MSKRKYGFDFYIPFQIEADPSRKLIPGRVSFGEGVLELYLDGYGNCTMEPGHAPVAALVHQDGRPRLLVFADYDSEEPTHTIDLSKAKEPED